MPGTGATYHSDTLLGITRNAVRGADCRLSQDVVNSQVSLPFRQRLEERIFLLHQKMLGQN